MGNSEDIDRLRHELADSIRLADDDGVRRAYQDLLRAGHSRKEIMDEVMSLATASQHRPHVASENVAPFELRAPGEEIRSRIAEPEIHFVERVAAEFPLARGQPTAEATPPLPPEPEIEQKADGQEHRVPRFSRLRWAVMCAFITITALAAGAGGYLFFMNRGEEKPVGATAGIPPAPIQAPVEPRGAGPVPAIEEPASAARSENVADDMKGASPQASSPGVGSPTPGTIPAEERNKEMLPPAAPASGGVSASPTDNPATKATPDPALLARGDAAFAKGDLAAARLFYERAANAGDAQAALRLGQTYDPAFLAQIKGERVRPNASAAVRWYLQADKLGAPEAELMLRAMAKDLGISAPAQRQGSKR